MNDLRFALRALGKNPGFALAATLTLALGIGATTALFTVVNAVLLRPLPYPDPERLVRLYAAYPEQGVQEGGLSVPDFRDWAERSRTVPRMGLYTTIPSDLVLLREAEAREVETAHVSWGFFPTLGVAPAFGRIFREEDEIGDARVVVVSHDFWRSHLAADSAAVGRTVTLSDRQFQVIGVMPRGFGFPQPNVELWALLATIPETSIPLQLRFVRLLNAIGRLAPDVPAGRAREELSTIAAGLAREYPEANAGLEAATVVPLRETVVGNVRTPLLVLFGAVALVLLIACVNVANLLLARGITRGREMAIRAAIGAGRRHIVRMLLAESLLLAVIGGTVGCVLAVWGVDALLRGPDVLPRSVEIGVDVRVLGFALGLSVSTAVAFGMFPALAAARTDPARRLRQGDALPAGHRLWGRGGLVAAEVAVALVLLIGAALLTRSLWTLQRVDPGFRPDGALAVTMVIPQSRYPDRPGYLDAHRQLLERFRAMPGVEAAGSIRHAPIRSSGETIDWEVPERPAPTAAARESADILQVTPDVFRALGVPLLRGRMISADDRQDGPLVVVVNQAFARRAFPGQDPLRRTLRLGDAEATVVGVVGDVHQRGLDEPPAPTLYVSIEQIPRRAMTFILRTSGDPLALTGAVRDAIRAEDRRQAVTELTTLDAVVDRSVARPRFFALLLVGFSTLALALAAVGIYAVIAFAVRQRTREIGIRTALGADRRRTLLLVLRQGMAPVWVGLAAGLVGAVGLTRVLTELLFGVDPIDLPTYGAVVVVLATVALTACWIPGRRATGIEPMEALRHE